MIKTIAYFPLQTAQNSKPVLSAVLDCLQAQGIKTQENSWTADAAVIWSVLWHGRMVANKLVYQHYRNQNKPVIIVEIGALYRGHTWKIAVNNITRDGYYGHLDNLDWDRPRALGISLADQTHSLPHIVIAAQHRSSLQVQALSSVEHWISQQIEQIRLVTDRPIVLRPHPRCKLQMNLLPADLTVEHPRRLPNTYDSFDMHYNCHAVINYNSGPGTQAAISGVRPIVDASSLAWPVSISTLDLEKPYTVDREQWLVELCHTEYTLEEIKRGLWLKRIHNQL